MARFISLFVSGLTLSGVLALIAVGFVVLYKGTGVINFAQGDLVTFSTYIAIWGAASLGLPILLAYLVALLAMCVLGVVLERVAFAPLRKRPPLVVVIATLAAALVIEGFMALWQGAGPKALASPATGHSITIAGAHVQLQAIVVIVVSGLVILGLHHVVGRTRFGRNLRAVATDPETAALYGINGHRMSIALVVLSTVLAAVAGLLVAPTTTVLPDYGFNLMIGAFAAAVLGGFGSMAGVAIGAVIVGLAQQLLGGYVLVGYSESLPFLIMLAVIAFRPAGILQLSDRKV